jgi:hypothetical protein
VRDVYIGTHSTSFGKKPEQSFNGGGVIGLEETACSEMLLERP